MKPAPLAYRAAADAAEAARLLAQYGDEARCLAGGQSLLPLLNMRLVRPGYLIDLGRAADLQELSAGAAQVTVGAAVRQRRVETDPVVRQRLPLLVEALGLVAHPQIRNRGTVVGSLVHNDPAAELPAVALVTDAVLTVRSARSSRTVPAAEFFGPYFSTALAPGELVEAVSFGATPARTGEAVIEFSRRPGDFALAGLACRLTRGDDGGVARACLAAFGAGPVAQRFDALAAQMTGQAAGPSLWREVAAAVAAGVEPEGDLHASAAYRRHLTRLVAERALAAAWQRTGGE